MISLMVSKAISENSSVPMPESDRNDTSLSGPPLAMTLSSSSELSPSPEASKEVYTPQEVVATLGCCVGIFQVGSYSVKLKHML